MLNKLTQPQSIGARAVTGVFRSVSLTIAEAEAAIDPVKICLKKQLLRFWVDIHMLPEDSLLHPVLRRLSRSMKRFISPLQITAKIFAHIRLKNIETSYPFCIPP